jgi:hypothetical protein
MLWSSRPKRNYIRRKKSLNDSTALIKSTLCFINISKGTEMPPIELDGLARHHANMIEAACWDPRLSDMTDDTYQRLMLTKARQLCAILLCQYTPLGTPAPLPVPILKTPTAAGGSRTCADIEIGLPSEPALTFEAFECPRMPIDRDDLFMEADPIHAALLRIGA